MYGLVPGHGSYVVLGFPLVFLISKLEVVGNYIGLKIQSLFAQSDEEIAQFQNRAANHWLDVTKSFFSSGHPKASAVARFKTAAVVFSVGSAKYFPPVI